MRYRRAIAGKELVAIPDKQRFRWLAGVVVATAIAVAAVIYYRVEGDSPVATQITEDFRAPTAAPLVEPDRPDLLGEPRIDDEP